MESLSLKSRTQTIQLQQKQIICGEEKGGREREARWERKGNGACGDGRRQCIEICHSFFISYLFIQCVLS